MLICHGHSITKFPKFFGIAGETVAISLRGANSGQTPIKCCGRDLVGNIEPSPIKKL